MLRGAGLIDAADTESPPVSGTQKPRRGQTVQCGRRYVFIQPCADGWMQIPADRLRRVITSGGGVSLHIPDPPTMNDPQRAVIECFAHVTLVADVLSFTPNQHLSRHIKCILQPSVIA